MPKDEDRQKQLDAARRQAEIAALAAKKSAEESERARQQIVELSRAKKPDKRTTGSTGPRNTADRGDD